MTTRIYVYDTECTGLVAAYDRPIQYAACVYDEDANLVEEFNLRGRLPRYVIPSPKALLVNRQSIGAIQQRALSHYDLIRQIHDHISINSPAIVCSYNGIRYDEEILRHSFYGTLQEPYVTQWNGNERMDILTAAKAVAACAPGAIHVPVSEAGKRSFKLERLAAANGFAEHDAHDALGDVHATIHLAKVLFNNAPEVWKDCAAMRSKAKVLSLMHARKPLISIGWDHTQDGPRVMTLLPICADKANPNEWLCINLHSDIERLLAADIGSLREGFRILDGVSAIVRVKINAMPILLRISDPVAVGLKVACDPRGIVKLWSDPAFPERLRAAAGLRKSEFGEPTHPAEQLYSGGFFPASADKPVLRLFHKASPPEKCELVADLTDPRARHMAQWLIGSEWPEVLSKGDRLTIGEMFREHLMQEKAKWTTIPSALEEIRLLAADASVDQQVILDEYEEYLLNLRNGKRASVYA
ncbi:hypothetical protein [Alkalilacustris brevis]|uniref:hypothetical protein n=1 Tax=Alkalilacustris brevis TaxID=2026338 RepID=UPI000E0CFC71|nr:hypothetical protein [Alkalilacustris brevis]